MSDEHPELMRLDVVERREEEWPRFTVLAGWGTCPHCGQRVEAEAGGRGFCPSCSGAILAVVRQS